MSIANASSEHSERIRPDISFADIWTIYTSLKPNNAELNKNTATNIQVILSSCSSALVLTPLKLLADDPIAPRPSDLGSLMSTKNTVNRPERICIAKMIVDITSSI